MNRTTIWVLVDWVVLEFHLMLSYPVIYKNRICEFEPFNWQMRSTPILYCLWFSDFLDKGRCFSLDLVSIKTDFYDKYVYTIESFDTILLFDIENYLLFKICGVTYILHVVDQKFLMKFNFKYLIDSTNGTEVLWWSCQCYCTESWRWCRHRNEKVGLSFFIV